MGKLDDQGQKREEPDGQKREEPQGQKREEPAGQKREGTDASPKPTSSPDE
jgi:hypothetical protein